MNFFLILSIFLVMMMHLQLAAAMMGGLEDVQIKPGTKLLYLGAASGTTVSHCSDLVGPVNIVLNPITMKTCDIHLLVVCLSSVTSFFNLSLFSNFIPTYYRLQDGIVYAVEFSHRSGRDLLNVSKKRPNIVPIVEDARHPHKYRMLVGMVDTIFSDVAQPDQARIVALNAQYFLKNGGYAVISIKVHYQEVIRA